MGKLLRTGRHAGLPRGARPAVAEVDTALHGAVGAHGARDGGAVGAVVAGGTQPPHHRAALSPQHVSVAEASPRVRLKADHECDIDEHGSRHGVVAPCRAPARYICPPPYRMRAMPPPVDHDAPLKTLLWGLSIPLNVLIAEGPKIDPHLGKLALGLRGCEGDGRHRKYSREGRAFPEDSRLWITCPAAGAVGDGYPTDS